MEFMFDFPTWAMALVIFLLRIIDVSFGTLRTITVVNGRIRLSVFLGFVEVLIWITVVSQVISEIKTNPILLLAYAGGFAAGNAVGIRLERWIALGSCVVRMMSPNKGLEIAAKLRAIGFTVTTFEGQGRDGPRILVYVTCSRREMKRVIGTAKQVEHQLFYAVEPAREVSGLGPLPYHTGWRGILKKK